MLFGDDRGWHYAGYSMMLQAWVCWSAHKTWRWIGSDGCWWVGDQLTWSSSVCIATVHCDVPSIFLMLCSIFCSSKFFFTSFDVTWLAWLPHAMFFRKKASTAMIHTPCSCSGQVSYRETWPLTFWSLAPKLQHDWNSVLVVQQNCIWQSHRCPS